MNDPETVVLKPVNDRESEVYTRMGVYLGRVVRRENMWWDAYPEDTTQSWCRLRTKTEAIQRLEQFGAIKKKWR